MAWYANRQSGQVESLVPVGSTPTRATRGCAGWAKSEPPRLYSGRLRAVQVQVLPDTLHEGPCSPIGRASFPSAEGCGFESRQGHCFDPGRVVQGEDGRLAPGK